MKAFRACPRVTRRAVLNAGLAAIAAPCYASPFLQQGSGRVTTDDPPFKTPAEPANTPLGKGKGVNPGRVVWAHDPKAAQWDGKTGNWWEDAATDPRLVDDMLSRSLRSLTGDLSDRQAWASLFKFFNESRKLGGGGYRPGEKIAVKLNSNQDRPGAWRHGRRNAQPAGALFAGEPTDYVGRRAGPRTSRCTTPRATLATPSTTASAPTRTGTSRRSEVSW